MKYFIKSMLMAGLLSATLTGCITDDDYGVPNADCVEPALTANKTVAQIFAAATNTATLYTADDVIEGYVVSSDERGNFFKVIYVQTQLTEGAAPVGFSVAIDKTTLFGDNFYPGRKIYVKLNGLYIAKENDGLAIGALYEGEIGRINENQYKNFIFSSCSEVSEDNLVRPLTLAQALNNANLNTLIELQNVQFKADELGGAYFDEDSENTAGGATNRYLMDSVGNEIPVRTSSFANFSGNLLPEGSGTLRGVLTKYGSDFQFVLRSEVDVNMEGERFVVVLPDTQPAFVGSAITYGTYNETFESYAVANKSFPNAINDAVNGSRYWQVASFSNNKYIQMTSFGGAAEANRSFFVVPVNFGTATDAGTAGSFQFQSKDGYNNGAVLKVYYSTNYVPDGNIAEATLVDITSSFAISTGNTSGYGTNFVNSGIYSAPVSLAGNGYFIFEYVGNGTTGLTTTMQLDNIKVQ